VNEAAMLNKKSVIDPRNLQRRIVHPHCPIAA
jgi:hypothetical protein